jgi:16S rRNA processing protein RimM
MSSGSDSSGGGDGRGPDWVVLGRLRRPWGRHGEMLVELHTDWPHERFAAGNTVRITWDSGRTAEKQIRSYRELNQGPLIALAGVDGIGPAQDMAGGWLLGPNEDAAGREPGELHHADLLGLEVRTADGTLAGRVAAIEEGAAADLLRVARPGGGEVLVPLAPAICVAVDLDAGVLTIDPPPGLLDLDEAEEA